jgi:hypothetical protein
MFIISPNEMGERENNQLFLPKLFKIDIKTLGKLNFEKLQQTIFRIFLKKIFSLLFPITFCLFPI